MKNLEIANNWSNLPKNIILNIGKYLNDYYRPSIKLINKHWSTSVNPLLFYSIKKFQKNNLEFIIGNCTKFIKFLDNNGAGSLDIIRRISKKTDKIEVLRWWSGTEECLTVLIELLIKCRGIKSLLLTDCEFDDDETGHNLNWDALIEVINSHPSLEALDICTRCTYLLPLFSNLPQTSIKQLVLYADSDQVESCMKVINSSKKLKHLEITVTNPEYPEDFSDTTALANPSELLLNNNLEYLSVWIYYYYYTETAQFKVQLANEFFNIFQNPNFSSLKSFNWHFWFPSFILETDLFNEPIALRTPIWTKLTKLSLFAVDKFLMSYIIEHCPNLCELTFNSPMVLPYNHDSNTLQPLKHLKKLLFGGFKVELKESFQVIRYLFPNVTTLSLYDISAISDSVVLDGYYIPLLFPNLRRVIFETEDCNLDSLIDYWKDELHWEELFISLDSSNQSLLKPLLKVLPKLSILYLFSSSLDINLDKLGLEPSNLRIFSASASIIMGFGIRISKELEFSEKKVARRLSV
ncbi:hypothetical protein CONCODRAFT_87301 [Conidiobolus coronatus NRRL 28638]|uniref:F-box domain-containing protein n=1 Tax=Conidiobolus coronatus (strain ATCC 28846 / CBS 209.66 / NRRL 28638) TaxID=796925 RepID=A0A137NVI6_CONC2|nr:hypothetical protein CONCODRAFT_87301 [Conidiobolus coronatus NRRL 28638]|eukprot:KXN66776.1 hypothetical protein CONCODRAFT_87301 [Conidiobolus coronatus NRRL 28638]